MKCGIVMEIEDTVTPIELSDRVVSNMKLFCDVARENGATISLKDLIAVTSIDCSEEELSKSWESYAILSSRYKVASGLVLEKIEESKVDLDVNIIVSELTSRFDRANSNIEYAIRFGAMLERAGSPFEVCSISGSTSYLSVSETDDLDFFCIAKSGTMWVSFVRALIFARVFRFSTRKAPWICLSYVSDEQFVRLELSRNQNGLFARDAISTMVVRGEEHFLNLLKENSWMALYFPKLYSLRIREEAGPALIPRQKIETAPPLERIINLFLYYTAGSYIRVKSNLLNRKFSRDRKFSSQFNLRIGTDHCIYESADYMRLRKLYASLSKKGSGSNLQP
jgi:hypothetical protein